MGRRISIKDHPQPYVVLIFDLNHAQEDPFLLGYFGSAESAPGRLGESKGLITEP
jgi:hypothetical protein